MNVVEFEVDVTEEDVRRFAELSGDWNPLHTDVIYAAGTTYRRPVLHGAFSAALMSRMAGMHLPGGNCLLHGMRLKFVSPILPPARLVVRGRMLRESAETGQVEVVISNADTGTRYVEGGYEFGYHQTVQKGHVPAAVPLTEPVKGEPVILITGASGGLGGTLLSRLGNRAAALGRDCVLDVALANRPISGIVHCGWPSLDNERLTGLGSSAASAVQHYIAEPLTQMISLANLLVTHGEANAQLVLIGSTAAEPGRHNYRMPLYSLAKTLVPSLVNILAVELGARGMRCIGLEFDALDGGMNADLKPSVRISHADRSPFGCLGTLDDAAGQVEWVLGNASTLVSGAVIRLSGGSMP